MLRHNATYQECARKNRKDATAYFRLFFQHATRRTNYFEQILRAAKATSRNCATTCARVSNEMTVCAWLQKSFRRGRVATAQRSRLHRLATFLLPRTTALRRQPD